MVKKVNAIQIINTSDSVKKADYYTKIEEFENKIPGHEKYITTNDFNKFLGTIFDERLKQAKLATGNDLNTVVKRAIKNEEKIEKLQTFHLSYFLGKHFFGDDGFQNMFAHEPTFSTLFFFFSKGSDFAIAWKSEGLFKSKILPHKTFWIRNRNTIQ